MAKLLILIVFLVPCMLVFLCALQYRSWKAPYPAIAFLPLLPIPVWLAKFIVDIKRDPTSHNLFPFEIFFLVVLGFGILLVVALLHTLWLNRRSKKLGA